MVNPWSLAGLKHMEVRNAAVLAGLWSTGDVGVSFLDSFFRRIDGSAQLPSRSSLEAGYVVRTEDCPTGAFTERVDITIESEKFLVGIEVKIYAGPGERQLERYTDAIRARAANRPWKIVFLAPYSIDLPNVIVARWRDVAGAAETTAAQYGRDSHHAWLVARFGEHVLSF